MVFYQFCSTGFGDQKIGEGDSPPLNFIFILVPLHLLPISPRLIDVRLHAHFGHTNFLMNPLHCVPPRQQKLPELNGVLLITELLEFTAGGGAEDVFPGLALFISPRKSPGHNLHLPVQSQHLHVGDGLVYALELCY